MRLPDSETWQRLSGIERLSYRLGAMMRETEVGNRVGATWLSRVADNWMRPLTIPFAHVDGRLRRPRTRLERGQPLTSSDVV